MLTRAMLMVFLGILATISCMTYAGEPNDGWDDSTFPVDIKRVPPNLRKRVMDEKALLKVAHAFEDGKGVPQDKNFAAKWYERAANEGSEVAKEWLTREAERGEIAAAMYIKGAGMLLGASKEIKAAGRELIRKAADAGYPDAEMELGLTYYEGRDLPKDMEAAVRYLKKAAVYGENVEDNHVTFGTLGRIYDDEKSGYYNPEQAYYFLLIASRLVPSYYTTRWANEYDKLTPERMSAIKKLAASWKAGMPLWEAGKE